MSSPGVPPSTNVTVTSLTNEEIGRYGRQMILDDIGLPGQEALKMCKVLIVGMGGLGCPCSQYLVAAGVGTLGLLDDDVVDTSNLHRQVLHGHDMVGVHKVDSAHAKLRNLNPLVNFVLHKVDLNASNAMDIIKEYDVIMDCLDNATTRYLVNDCCVILNKILVSGAALRLEGQVSTYHYKGGPCYRCINPLPPDPQTTPACFEAGVLGPITGIVGSLQAAEAIKIITTGESAYSGKLMLVSPWDGIMKTVQLRPRRAECVVCGDNPSVTAPIDYVRFCGAGKDKVFGDASLPTERVTVQELASLSTRCLIDVRPAVEFGICALRDSVNAPFYPLMAGKIDLDTVIPTETRDPVYIMCRAGINSQIVVQHLKNKYPHHCFKDIVGGIVGWNAQVDPTFPLY